MTVVTWDEYLSMVTDKALLASSRLDVHPDDAERSTLNRHVCLCKECRDAIDEEYHYQWSMGWID
jgi:hypothetical protein